MTGRVAVFIDGGYLDNVLLKFSKARIDYEKMVNHLAGNIPLLRAYYYHCLPHQSSNPTDDESREFSNAVKFQRTLSRLNSFTVRRGKLAYRGIDDKGNAIFEQKRVDVYLATDLVMHSTKRLITHAVIVTGDSDFIPAVEIAQSEGVHTTLFYADNSIPHDELLDAVDARNKITPELITTWKRNS
ncbi:NYN domain-containing protein [Paenibacillus naphthalenovorans]|uniref:NYN domain-containing protein n=1 Tax=Paenibacillus naphthalenovorans TaxID=162209 RepID=A0A0U2WFC0_9BACL|nr:NYN domain-containing protein [Paenibacillus naphthalenovorans]ALS24042.1 NYN domain-containing protein [Paenibacillus naphthalenovorans]SDI95197.1 Uncharacterized conserved protein, LabA/DUF88 family [Paenibacillus naphthalenovorans]